jgi:hypothetical protein
MYFGEQAMTGLERTRRKAAAYLEVIKRAAAEDMP